MTQDSVKTFLQKESSAPFETTTPIVRERTESVVKDTAKKNYIERLISKGKKEEKDKQKDRKQKQSTRGAEKQKEKGKQKEANKDRKTETKKESSSQSKEKKEKGKTKESKELAPKDTAFRFNDAPLTTSADSETLVINPGEATVSDNKLFSNHTLQVRHKYPQPSNKENTDWVFFTLLLAFAAFVWVKVFYRKIFQQIVEAFFNNRITNQIVRDENILVQRASVLLTIIFNLVSALLLYYISIRYDWNPDYVGAGFSRFLIFCLAISFIYSIKFLLLKVTGYIFMIDHAVAVYIFNIFLINNLLGIVLLPAMSLVAFAPPAYQQYALYASFIFLGSAFLYRIMRGILLGLSESKLSIFYLFLYLCTLEIAPVLIIVKIFVF